jgi:hypothetical protein
MRVLQGGRAHGDGAIHLVGVGADCQLVAGVFVAQETEVIRHIAHSALVTRVQVQLHTGVATRVLDPLDAGAPGADIQTALVGVVDTALHGRLEARLGNATVTVVTGGPHVERQAAFGRCCLGLCQTTHRTQSQGDQGRNEDFLHEELQ